MKKFLIFLVYVFILCNGSIFAQRAATHTIKNFTINYVTDKYSFDIYSLDTGSPATSVGYFDYCFTFNSAYISNPVLSNVNSKYTSSSPTGDYAAMNVTIISGPSIRVAISFTGAGMGTGDLLSTSEPDGELICTVTTDFVETPGQFTQLDWDLVNSGFITPNLNLVNPTYVGEDLSTPLPVELSSFTASINQSAVNLKWQTKTEFANYGFEVERAPRNPKSDLPAETSVKAGIRNPKFEKIGFVQGYGNSNSPKDYSFLDKSPSGGSKFIYRLKQIDNDGKFEYSDEVEIELVPDKFELYQNYPNPFNPETNIKFAVPKAGNISLSVYSILGEKVKDLISGFYEPGIYNLEFNAKDLGSGTYIYRLQGENFVQVKKMLLVK
jgi:hypothetical protein